MSATILQRTGDFTPDVATELLRHSGVLTSGCVVNVEQLTTGPMQRGFVAEVARFRLAYDAGASGDLPKGVFLKMSKPLPMPGGLRVDQREVEFYRATATTADMPIPRIYSAAMNAAGDTHLVMADLTDSHVLRPAPVPPTVPQCEAVVAALARLHALWWNSPRIDTAFIAPSAVDAEALRTTRAADYAAMAGELGDALLPEQRALYESILASGLLRQNAERVAARRDVTLVHGDLHPGNIMLPTQPGGYVALIDWHECFVSSPTFDLAFFMAQRWTRERRALLEQRMLELYHATLVATGVSGYSLEECWNDYRRDVMACLLRLLEYYRRRMPIAIIWGPLQNASTAATDLNCRDLL